MIYQLVAICTRQARCAVDDGNRGRYDQSVAHSNVLCCHHTSAPACRASEPHRWTIAATLRLPRAAAPGRRRSDTVPETAAWASCRTEAHLVWSSVLVVLCAARRRCTILAAAACWVLLVVDWARTALAQASIAVRPHWHSGACQALALRSATEQECRHRCAPRAGSRTPCGTIARPSELVRLAGGVTFQYWPRLL